MTTASHHNQTFAAHVDNNRLIIINPGVGLPRSGDFCLLILDAFFKICGTFNLSSDKLGIKAYTYLYSHYTAKVIFS
jgi:hypothetical protein